MNTMIQDKMVETDLDWRKWLKNGDQYLKAVIPDGTKSRFDTDIRYNLLSMALEGYIMAITDYHNFLPDNHTYTDLMDGLERVVSVDPDLKQRILKHANIQSICSIEKYHRDNHPKQEELDDLRLAVIAIQSMAHATCNKND
jgi:hypothetical protein